MKFAVTIRMTVDANEYNLKTHSINAVKDLVAAMQKGEADWPKKVNVRTFPLFENEAKWENAQKFMGL